MNQLGTAYEDRAVAWLQARGWRVLARNVLCRSGELDIVALDTDCLVFIEVRARGNSRYAGAAASVDRRKQLRLVRSAQWFLQRHPHWADFPCRFDLITFEPRQSASSAEPEWIRAAFTA